MSGVLRVLFNLALYSGILYIGIKILSKIFDIGTKKYMGLEDKKRNMLTIGFVILVGLIPIILMNNTYALRTAVLVLIYIVLALSLNFVLGFAGQLSIGHSAFYAIGAYTTAILTVSYGVPFWIALFLSAVVSAIFGLLLGIPTLRLKGDYLAITTIGFSEILRLVLINWASFTRGPAGIPGIPSPTIFGFTLSTNTSYYYILYILALFTIFISYRLINSRLGRGLIVGATVLTILPESLRGISTYRYAIYGILLVMMMIVRPQGIISAASLKGIVSPSSKKVSLTNMKKRWKK